MVTPSSSIYNSVEQYKVVIVNLNDETDVLTLSFWCVTPEDAAQLGNDHIRRLTIPGWVRSVWSDNEGDPDIVFG